MIENREADARVAAVIESSAVFAVLAGALDAVFRSVPGSVAAAQAARVATAWRLLDLPQQRLAAGTAVLVAVAVHVALVLVTELPRGWFWLVIPGIAAAIGLLLVAMPGLQGAARR